MTRFNRLLPLDPVERSRHAEARTRGGFLRVGKCTRNTYRNMENTFMTDDMSYAYQSECIGRRGVANSLRVTCYRVKKGNRF